MNLIPTYNLPMSLKVNIDHNFHDLTDMMDDLGNKDIAASAKFSINRTLTRGRKTVIKQIKRDINLKALALKSRIIINKAKSNSMSSMKGSLNFSGFPISMLNFVVGNKSNIKLKGVKVKKRRKLKARIAPGKTFHLKGGFIQDVKSKAVFRRKSTGKFRKISSASVAVIAFRRPRITMLEKVLVTRFNREFAKQIEFRHAKTTAKYSRSPMRLPK